MTDGCLQQSLVMVMTAGCDGRYHHYHFFLSGQTRIRGCGQMPPSRRGPKLWSPISVGGPCVILVLPGLLARIEKTSMAQTGQACPVASLVRVTCHGPLCRDPAGRAAACL